MKSDRDSTKSRAVMHRKMIRKQFHHSRVDDHKCRSFRSGRAYRTFWPSCLVWSVLLGFLLIDTAVAQTSDNRSYCKADGRIALFLVDITTPYDKTDKDIIVKATDKILASLNGGEKIIIRTITDSLTRSEQLIERCIPYCAAEGFSRIFLCNDGAIRTDREGVYADIVEALRQRLAKFEETRHSDILRTVVLAAKEDAVQGRPLSLYIYSDLIENSDYLSGRKFFSTPVDRLIGQLRKDKLIAPLKNANVLAAGVGRGGTKDRRPLGVAEQQKVTDFWKAYFKEAGATSVEVGQNLLEPSK